MLVCVEWFFFFFYTFGSSRRLRRSYKKEMIVEIDDDFLSLPSRKRGQRKSRLVVLRLWWLSVLRVSAKCETWNGFFSFWTCVPPSPSLSVGFRRWRRKEKETRWIAVINQTKRKRLGLGDWKWIEVTLSTDHARGPQLDDIIFSLIHSNKGQRGGIRQTTTLKCR